MLIEGVEHTPKYIPSEAFTQELLILLSTFKDQSHVSDRQLHQVIGHAQILVWISEVWISNRFENSTTFQSVNPLLVRSYLDSAAATLKYAQQITTTVLLLLEISQALEKCAVLKEQIAASDIAVLQLPQLIADAKLVDAIKSGNPYVVWQAVGEFLHRTPFHNFELGRRQAMGTHLIDLCQEVSRKTGVAVPADLLTALAAVA